MNRIYNELQEADSSLWNCKKWMREKDISYPIKKLYLWDGKTLVWVVWKKTFRTLFSSPHKITALFQPDFILPFIHDDEKSVSEIFPDFKIKTSQWREFLVPVETSSFALCGDEVFYVTKDGKNTHLYKVISCLCAKDMVEIVQMKGYNIQGFEPKLADEKVVWFGLDFEKDDVTTNGACTGVAFSPYLAENVITDYQKMTYLIGREETVLINGKTYRLQYSIKKCWYFSPVN